MELGARVLDLPLAAPAAPRRLRLAWVEEWMSTLAAEVLPYLARQHEVYYVTAGTEIPQAAFAGVIHARRWRYMNLAGFELSHHVNRLYREGLIELALVWASIGFGLRRVPFINLEGTSVYAEIELFAAREPPRRRLRFLPGLAHYALPEMVCNRRARRTVVPSEALKQDLVRLHHLPPERVAVVPHGVEPRHLALYLEKPRDLPPRLLFVGRLHFRKGLLPVLRAFARRREIRAEFLIAGDGPERAEVEKLAANDSRLKVLGTVDREQLATLLSQTNIFVFPTFYEGFGLALTEAMASGHACVAYDIPVVREVLEGSGILVPPGDADRLVEELATLVRQPEAIVLHAARAHWHARRFCWNEARAAIERIAAEVAEGRDPVPAA